jgi:hypothetical protein
LVGCFSNERAQPFPSLLYILAFGARSREENLQVAKQIYIGMK